MLLKALGFFYLFRRKSFFLLPLDKHLHALALFLRDVLLCYLP